MTRAFRVTYLYYNNIIMTIIEYLPIIFTLTHFCVFYIYLSEYTEVPNCKINIVLPEIIIYNLSVLGDGERL